MLEKDKLSIVEPLQTESTLLSPVTVPPSPNITQAESVVQAPLPQSSLLSPVVHLTCFTVIEPLSLYCVQKVHG